MPLPVHLLGKLRQEYARAADSAAAIRCAITIAALYSGVIGSQLDQPWNVVAKIQWLLKAIELGSHAAISPLIAREDVIVLLEKYGPSILDLRHRSFESPQIVESVLHSRLRVFAEMPDEASANVLVWLGGNLNWRTFEERVQTGRGEAEIDEVKVYTAEENLRQFARFTVNRQADFEIVDSDAFDLNLAEASEIVQSVHHNALEDFIRLSEKQGLEPKDEIANSLMPQAIFHGSLDVVRYLSIKYGIHPNDKWNKMPHLNCATLFTRVDVMKYFLENGGVIIPAQNDELSALHMAVRQDNTELINMLCGCFKEKGQLEQVLESRTSVGPLRGWTVAYTAACCRSWKCLEVLFSFGADPNCIVQDQPRIIDYIITPQSPAVPISTLKMVLEASATASSEEYPRSPLQFAVGSSNVSALYLLILHGVTIPKAALADAEENVAGMIDVLPVKDEDGNQSLNGWTNICMASKVVLELLKIGKRKRGNWKKDLEEVIEESSLDCRGKLWITDVKDASYFVEVRIPN